MSSSSNHLITPQKRRSARNISSYDSASPTSSLSSSPSDTLILTPSSPSRSSPSSSPTSPHACPFSPGASTIKRIKLNVTPTKAKPRATNPSAGPICPPSDLDQIHASNSAHSEVTTSRPSPIQQPKLSKGKKAQAAVTARRANGPGPSPLKNTTTTTTTSSSSTSTPISPPVTPFKNSVPSTGRTPNRSGSPGLTFDKSDSGTKQRGIPIGPSTPPRSTSKFDEHSRAHGVNLNHVSPRLQPRTLPPHLHTLLLLNNALDLALSLHMAMHPPLLPPRTSTSAARSDHPLRTGSPTYIDLPETANFLNLKGIVEQTCSRRFGVGELRRLVWIWGWLGVGKGRIEGGADDEGLGMGASGLRMDRKRKRTISAGEEDEGIEIGSGSVQGLGRMANRSSGKALLGGLSDDEKGDLPADASPTRSKGTGMALMRSLKDMSSGRPDRNPFLVEDEADDDEDFVISSPARRATARNLFNVPSSSSPSSNPSRDRDIPEVIAFPHHALSHILTATRTIDPSTSRRVYTYGFGIRIALTAVEGMEMGHSAAVGSGSGLGSGLFDGFEADSIHRSGGRDRLTMTDAAGEVTSSHVKSTTRWVGRWSAGAEKRSKEVERRLWEWVESHGGVGSSPLAEDDDLGNRRSDLVYTPSSSTGATAIVHPLDRIPQIPMAVLPSLPTSPASGLLPAFTLPGLRQAQSQTSLAPAFGSPSPRKTLVNGMGHLGQGTGANVASASVECGVTRALETDVFGPVQMISQKKVVPGSVANRRQAMYDRIKARQGGGGGVPSSNGAKLGSGGLHANMSASERQTELKRMSTLSRLEGIAEGVWMFFSNGPAGGAGYAGLSSPGSPKARRRAFPMHEVVDIVVKSSKTPISSAEAKDSLALLTDLCPTFLLKRVIARQEWLEMPAQNQVVPASPKKDFAGPASPGKVTGRTVGLREVRERIRKELGEW